MLQSWAFKINGNRLDFMTSPLVVTQGSVGFTYIWFQTSMKEEVKLLAHQRYRMK